MPKYPARTYEDIEKDKANFDYLRNRFKVRQYQVKENFAKKFPHVEKFFKDKGISLEKIRQHSAKILGAGALTGTLLLAPPSGMKALPTPQEIIEGLKSGKTGKSDLPQKFLIDELSQFLPKKTRPLSR